MVVAIIWTLAVLLALAFAITRSKDNINRMTLATGIIFLVCGLLLFFLAFGSLASVIISGLFFVVLGCFAIVLRIAPLHTRISNLLFAYMQKSAPRISSTEAEAIEAGDVCWEKALFLGDYAAAFGEARQVPVQKLTTTEKKFLANETEALCKLCPPAALNKHKGLPPAAFDYIKKHKFWGMIIPKSEGGLGFSAAAHAEIIAKLASASPALGVMVMVPNSLGPGELLIRYGTKEQRKFYLPRLAKGDEVTCFALTSVAAGSDAGAMEDHGILCRRTVNKKTVLGFRLKLKKRYITLAPIATLIGVAFKAYDPDNLLAGVKFAPKADQDHYLGITCALLSRRTKGLGIGRRHDPMGLFFHNGPIEGEEIFVPLEDVIGGAKQIGKGWRMLMECLAAGRGISIPAVSQAGAELGLFSSVCYTNVRRQFGLPLASFEGVAENLTQLGINAYAINAMRSAVTDLIDVKQKPALASALIKYYATETVRDSALRAMDLHGGKGIMRGDRNYLEELYRNVPIGITVEGANILTRCMIIFGQGIMRCHPFLRAEAEALAAGDKKEFNTLFWKHFMQIASVKSRAFTASWSGGFLIRKPGTAQPALRKYHRRLATLSAQFAFLVEMALFFLGGSIKRRESISGRFADAWCALFTALAALRQYENDGMPESQLPLVRLLLAKMTVHAQQSLMGIASNLPLALIPWRFLLWPLGSYALPRDRAVLAVARDLGDPSSKTLTEIVGTLFRGVDSPMTQLHQAFTLASECLPVMRRIKKAGHSKAPYETQAAYLARLVKGKIITAAESKLWQKAEAAAMELLAVDDFAELK